MFTNERRAAILTYLEEHHSASVSALAEHLNTSEVTIRKDLTELHQRNMLIRTRGGALRVPNLRNEIDATLEHKQLFSQSEKQAIGLLAVSLIQDGETIMIDSGTTTIHIVRNLDRFNHLTIITNALNIAMEAMRYKRFTIILLGGHLRNSSLSTVGPLAESTLRNLYCDKLFLGIDAISPEDGLSTPNIEEAKINQTMIAMSQETIAVCDSSKFRKRTLVRIAGIHQITAIVTDNGLEPATRQILTDNGIKVYITE